MPNSSVYDALVVGGGLVGSAIAYGLQRLGLSTLVLDENDVALRAARGNFGLIWVQGKGVNYPPYAQWTWKSAQSWPELNNDLHRVTGETIGYQRPGGIAVCLDAEEIEQTRAKMSRLRSHSAYFEFQMLDRQALAQRLPGLGQEIAGGCYSSADGHVNPLFLLRGLHQGLRAMGGQIVSGSQVNAVQFTGTHFSAETLQAHFRGKRLILAAGLGTESLAAQLGMNVPVRPQRGQILVTERLQHFLDFPMSQIRQTAEGSVQLGVSNEEVGFDDGTQATVLNQIAHRAVRVFPHLAKARIVRAWGALRVMTPDGYPIYTQSQQFPGAFAAVCHSGVTLAAAHALHLAADIAKGTLPEILAPLGPHRFENA